MTCLEKLKLEHPDKPDYNRPGGLAGCPSHYGYLPDPEDCMCEIDCVECWNREIPEFNAEVNKNSIKQSKFESSRFDLMPLEVVCHILNPRGNLDKVVRDIANFMKYNETGYLYSAIESFQSMAYRNSCYTMLLDVSKYFEEYKNDWQKGTPVNQYINAAIQHYLKWFRGDTDEAHDRAFVYNLMCCIWEADYHV
jgi:hypothetical protein